jgi:acyl-CoA synthetase (AMP-forming)/AMP-acid ligase II
VRPGSIASLLDHKGGAQPALAWGAASLDWQTLRSRVDALARRLDGHHGQRIAVIAPNVPALVVGMFAAWRAGAVVVPLNSRLRRYELERVFADAEPWAAISLANYAGFPIAQVVQKLAPAIPTLALCIVVDELGHVIHESQKATTVQGEPLDDEASTILYTSGTTGEPKGAIERHSKGLSVARSFAEVLGPYAEEPCGYAIPVSHCFGLSCLLATLGAGALAVLVDAAGTLEPVLSAMRRHRVGVLHGSPALFTQVLHASGDLPTWHSGFIAGSSCPAELVATLDRHGARMLGQYGLTEAGNVTACRLDDPSETRYRTVGRALPGYEVRAVAVPDAQDDEIQVRSPYIWPTLLSRPWTEEEVTADGWLRTGDLGSVDDDGNVVIVGRAKHVVQTAGFTVHPAVSAAVVVGIPHAGLGEALAAFVVPTPGTSFDRRAFMGFCRAGIAGYKVPYKVHVMSELPLLASGKPDRGALARDAQARA